MSRISAQQKVNNRISSKKRKIAPINIIVIVAVAILLVGGIAVYAMVGLGNKSDANSFNQVITPENIDQIMAEMATAERTPAESYEVHMNTTWTFKNSLSPSTDAIVSNNKVNTTTVYFTIALKNSNEDIYKSPYLPVGSSLKNIVLDKPLSAGSYPAIITYHLVDDNYVEKGKLSINLTLNIQN